MVERFFLHDGTIKSMQIRSLVFTLANYLYQLPEIFGMNISDIADTESVGLRNLSRIDDKSTLFQLCVESFEIEIGNVWKPRERMPSTSTRWFSQYLL